jgi:hypothetical protein
MTWVRTRNYSDIQIGADIPSVQTTSTTTGEFSVETSITSIVDTATLIPMKRIEVLVSAVGRDMTPVSLVNFATERTIATGTTSYVSVTVNCTPMVNANSAGMDTDASLLMNAGTPVQLRNIDDVDTVVYTAVTDADNVATFPSVKEGQYWLTVDPTYPIVHANDFPQRIAPTPNSLNDYSLGVTQPDKNGASQAYLRVGAYRSGGWYIDSASSPHQPSPYDPVEGLTIHAQPVFNPADPGSTGLLAYPSNTGMIYSGVVNMYGVACIKIPWTLDPSNAASGVESWHVWADTTNGDMSYDLVPYSGTWISTDQWASLEQVPDGTSSGATANILQWSYVLGDLK